MTEYVLDSGGSLTVKKGAGEPFLVTMSTQEFRVGKNNYPFYREMQHSLGSIRYCKAEAYRDCIVGTLRVPKKSDGSSPEVSLGFCLTQKTLFILTEQGEFKSHIQHLAGQAFSLGSPSQLLLEMLEVLMKDDILYISHIEHEIELMEEELIAGKDNDIFRRLTKHRHKLSELTAYYEQLAAIGELLSSDKDDPAAFSWEKFTRRAERLQDHAELVAENALQLRELYQYEQDSRQNRIMGILTIVTTLFLPLTLLTGWYGMNFKAMPELSWRYGYVAVAVAAVVIIIIEIICIRSRFRKK